MSGPEIVILTGAGVSAESGLGTFRDTDGIWAKFDPRDLATPEAFERDPDRVLAFYNERRRQAAEAEPNDAHRALGRLHRALGDRLLLVTQNVDDLHERGGARALHMHGSLFSASCAACGTRRNWSGDITTAMACPACNARRLRPDVVWFGEMPQGLDVIYEALEGCRIFASIGTSGEVQPAASFVLFALAAGADCYDINIEAAYGRGFTHHLIGPATEQVPRWVDQILAEV
ncbi:MAG: NAD-dependent deacylase [Pseudomonadota bacterium]